MSNQEIQTSQGIVRKPASLPFTLPFFDPATALLQLAFPVNIKLEVDKVLPTLRVERGIQIWQMAGLFFKGTVFEGLTGQGIANAPYVVTVDGDVFSEGQTDSGGVFGFAIQPASLPIGSHQLRAYLFDSASPIFTEKTINIYNLECSGFVILSVGGTFPIDLRINNSYLSQSFVGRSIVSGSYGIAVLAVRLLNWPVVDVTFKGEFRNLNIPASAKNTFALAQSRARARIMRSQNGSWEMLTNGEFWKDQPRRFSFS